MERIFYLDIFCDWIINNDLIQARSLLSLSVKYLAAKEIEALFCMVQSLESISTCNRFFVICQLWEYNIPLALLIVNDS